MSRIYTIGETVYDIIFKNDEPVTAKAGGAMLNTAVSLGRLGLPVHFVSEYAVDRAGEIIDDFLKNNGVDTTSVYRYREGKTAVSLAFLDESNNARYSFHKIYPQDRLSIDVPDFKAGDIVLFGGFYSLMKEVRSQIVSLVSAAMQKGALVIYDPNVRSPHKDEIEELRSMVYENLEMADLVRGSDEDFMTILNIPDAAGAYELVREHGCDHLVYTRSNVDVTIMSPEGKTIIPVPAVDVVSTIGAGDSLNAGLIYELFRSESELQDISAESFERMVKTAISFGSHVCTHYENYITENFALAMNSPDK